MSVFAIANTPHIQTHRLPSTTFLFDSGELRTSTTLFYGTKISFIYVYSNRNFLKKLNKITLIFQVADI